MSRSIRRVYPPGKLPLQHHLFVEEDPPNDEKSRGATAPSNSAGFESPLIAVPFKWELEPGVPKQKLDRLHEEMLTRKKNPPLPPDRTIEKDFQQSDHTSPSPLPSRSPSLACSLAPPPRLMVISSSSSSRKAGPALSSPRSPRSISLSRKMKSLLQGKLPSPRKIFSEQQQQQQQRPSLWEWESEKVVVRRSQELDHRVEEELVDRRCCVSRCCSSNDIVFEGELLDLHPGEKKHPPPPTPPPPPPPPPPGLMPFKNMSSMLLELWYGGGSSSEMPVHTSGSRSPVPGFFRDEFPLESSASGSSTASSSKSSSIVSPTTSSSSSSDLESPNSLGSFSSSDSSHHDHHHHQILHVPRHDHEFQTSFDPCDEVKLVGYASDDDEYGGGFDFAAAAGREFFAKNFYYHSDRFRVESCESPSLLGAKQLGRSAVPPLLPSALKSGKNSKKCLKKVRFACVEEEVEREKAEDDPEVDEDEDDELVVASPSPALSRFSSRPASRFYSVEEEDDGFYRYSDELSSSEPCSPSPRCARRDPSQLLLRIIQADAAESSRKSKSALKSVFGSSRSRW